MKRQNNLDGSNIGAAEHSEDVDQGNVDDDGVDDLEDVDQGDVDDVDQDDVDDDDAGRGAPYPRSALAH